MKLSNEGQLASWFQVKENDKVRQAIIISILLLGVLSVLLIGFYLKANI